MEVADNFRIHSDSIRCQTLCQILILEPAGEKGPREGPASPGPACFVPGAPCRRGCRFSKLGLIGFVFVLSGGRSVIIILCATGHCAHDRQSKLALFLQIASVFSGMGALGGTAIGFTVLGQIAGRPVLSAVEGMPATRGGAILLGFARVLKFLERSPGSALDGLLPKSRLQNRCHVVQYGR